MIGAPTWVRRLQRRVQRSATSCPEKTRYQSEFTARLTAQRALQRDGALDRLYPYGCPHCRSWHLTKSANGSVAVTRSAMWEGVD